MVPKGGLDHLSLRPARAAASAAGLGADGLPYVALILLFVGAPRPFESSRTGNAVMKKGIRVAPDPLWFRHGAEGGTRTPTGFPTTPSKN